MRWRLGGLVAATTSLVLIAFLVPLALLIRTVTEDRAMAGATTTAENLDAVVATGNDQAVKSTLARLEETSAYPVTLFDYDGRRHGAPAKRSNAVRLAQSGESLTAEAPGGREILVAVQDGGGRTAVIRTYVSNGQIYDGVVRAWLLLAGLGVVLLALALLVADRLAHRMTRPISNLAEVSHRLAAGDLESRAAPEGPPEIREVASGLNRLAERIQELLTTERERVADLSHRLRTPLTALRLEAESLPTTEDRERIEASASAIERAVTQTIDEARRPGEPTEVSCDAVAVLRDRVDFWSVLAEDQEREATVRIADGPLPVRLDADELASVIDALLGNVFAHTPEGTPFSVRLAPRRDETADRPASVVLEISDAGPGLPVRTVERGESHGGSTGLGMDIARRAAESSGGTLQVGTAPSGGARIVLRLGAAASGDDAPAAPNGPGQP